MADASIIDPKVAIGLVTTAFGVMGTVIGVLWKRIDTTNAKCVEDRDNQNKERAAENKAWFERVERLYEDRDKQARGMFDQVVKLAEKSKDSEHATINALVENGRMMSEVARTNTNINTTLTSLTGKIDDLGRDIRLSHGPTKDPPRG
jgi:hypothetical protein